MSKITIESIDQVMERVPGATYAQVKEALLKCDGDVVLKSLNKKGVE